MVNGSQLRSIGQGEYGLDKDYVQGADIHLSANERVPPGQRIGRLSAVILAMDARLLVRQ